MKNVLKRSIHIFVIALLWGCSTLSLAQEEHKEPWDPIEPVNRGIFWFNDQFDMFVAEPVARGYDYVMPDEAQASVTRFFRNLAWPAHLFDDLIALDIESAGVHTGRFLINSTIGVGGLFDVADDFGLKHKNTDLGLVLGRHGVGDGPYLVIPFLGPSNLRDLFGTTVDSYLDPVTLATYLDLTDNEKMAIFFGANGLRLINRRASLLEAIETAKEGTIDYYTFAKSSYNQNRKGEIDSYSDGNGEAKGVLNDREDEDFLPED
jgi:phospholipid-binding lipoprotein MlaA